MIIRIVKMTFAPEKVNDFLLLFESNKTLIAGFEGCTFLELLQDKNKANSYFTYSKWENEEMLNAYRNSKLFEKILPPPNLKTPETLLRSEIEA